MPPQAVRSLLSYRPSSGLHSRRVMDVEGLFRGIKVRSEVCPSELASACRRAVKLNKGAIRGDNMNRRRSLEFEARLSASFLPSHPSAARFARMATLNEINSILGFIMLNSVSMTSHRKWVLEIVHSDRVNRANASTHLLDHGHGEGREKVNSLSEVCGGCSSVESMSFLSYILSRDLRSLKVEGTELNKLREIVSSLVQEMVLEGSEEGEWSSRGVIKFNSFLFLFLASADVLPLREFKTLIPLLWTKMNERSSFSRKNLELFLDAIKRRTQREESFGRLGSLSSLKNDTNSSVCVLEVGESNSVFSEKVAKSFISDLIFTSLSLDPGLNLASKSLDALQLLFLEKEGDLLIKRQVVEPWMLVSVVDRLIRFIENFVNFNVLPHEKSLKFELFGKKKRFLGQNKKGDFFVDNSREWLRENGKGDGKNIEMESQGIVNLFLNVTGVLGQLDLDFQVFFLDFIVAKRHYFSPSQMKEVVKKWKEIEKNFFENMQENETKSGREIEFPEFLSSSGEEFRICSLLTEKRRA